MADNREPRTAESWREANGEEDRSLKTEQQKNEENDFRKEAELEDEGFRYDGSDLVGSKS